MSTCVGGGIVGLPQSMFTLGIPLCIVLMLLVMWSVHWSSNLFLYAKDIVPGMPETLYEIGYLVVGRASIYIIASIICINAFGLCIIYFIVFGDTAG